MVVTQKIKFLCGEIMTHRHPKALDLWTAALLDKPGFFSTPFARKMKFLIGTAWQADGKGDFSAPPGKCKQRNVLKCVESC